MSRKLKNCSRFKTSKNINDLYSFTKTATLEHYDVEDLVVRWSSVIKYWQEFSLNDRKLEYYAKDLEDKH